MACSSRSLTTLLIFFGLTVTFSTSVCQGGAEPAGEGVGGQARACPHQNLRTSQLEKRLSVGSVSPSRSLARAFPPAAALLDLRSPGQRSARGSWPHDEERVMVGMLDRGAVDAKLFFEARLTR